MKSDFLLELFDKISDGVYFVDKDKIIRYWSKGAERITGYSSEEVVGRSCSDNILRHLDKNGNELCLMGCPVSASLLDGALVERELFLHHKAGHRLPVHVRICPFKDDAGEICGAAEVFTAHLNRLDILRELEVLRKEVFVDQLSEIANRRFAELNLDMRIRERGQFKSPMGLLFIDIDDFKDINDAHGHNIGDKVIRMVGKTLSNIMRKMDVAARWGGEEFVAVVPNTNLENLAKIAERIRLYVERDWLEEDGKIIKATVSVGGTVFRDDDTRESFVERADKLMYQCKAEGKNKCLVSG